VPWSLPHLCQELADILSAREGELALEQAVRGLDANDERGIQALLAAGLATRHPVIREQFYPSSSGKLSHRPRCDLYLSTDDPLWLEVKVAHQFKEGGARNGRYAQQWRTAITSDLRKLKADPLIEQAAIAMVVFTADAETFERDAATFEQLLIDAELLAGWRASAALPISDRIGHTRCSVAIWPLV
jgi:hypothetical protein